MNGEVLGIPRGEFGQWEMKMDYPPYAYSQIEELVRTPANKEARVEMWRNVAEVDKRLEQKVDIGVRRDQVVEEITKTVMEVWEENVLENLPVENREKLLEEARENARRLGKHLNEVTDSVSLILNSSGEGFLDDGKVRLMVEIVAPMHDLFKLLGDRKGQIIGDHEQIAGYLMGKYLAQMGYTQEEADFVRSVTSDHENIYKENGRANYMKSPRPEERAKAVFFLADILTGVMGVEEGKLTVYPAQLKDRFEDLVYRHMGQKAFRPEWAVATVKDISEFVRVWAGKGDLSGGGDVIEQIVQSARIAVERAQAENAFKQDNGGVTYTDEQQAEMDKARVELLEI